MTDDMVRDVTVRSVVVPLRRPLATKVGDFARWPLLLIDVTTEQGITGRGYLAPWNAAGRWTPRA
jgi:mandelate racemase